MKFILLIGKLIFYPVQARLYQEGLVYQSNIGTHQEVKKAHRPPWGAMGLLAGAGDGHYGANAAPKGRPYGVDGKAPIDWFGRPRTKARIGGR